MLLGCLHSPKGKRYANVSMICQVYIQALLHEVKMALFRQPIFECPASEKKMQGKAYIPRQA